MNLASAVAALLLAFIVVTLNGCALVTVPVKTAGMIIQTPFKMAADDDDDDDDD